MNVNSQVDLPLVSVIIPTYNRPHYLREAIASAVRQRYQAIEIIVSDNCSPENPQLIIEAFQDPRIRFIRNEANLGMFTNTMNAFKLARGKYVASLLDDDLWEETFLAKLIPPLEANPDVAIAFCDHWVIDANGAIDEIATENCSRFYHRDSLEEGIYRSFGKLAIVDGAISPAMAAVIRRQVIDWESIPPEVGGSWDMYLNYLLCCSGLGAYYCPEKLTHNRQHAQTCTLSGKQNAQAKIYKAMEDTFCYSCFLKDEKLRDLTPYLQPALADAMAAVGIGLLRQRKKKEARTYLWQALSQKSNFRTLAALTLSFTPSSLASRF